MLEHSWLVIRGRDIGLFSAHLVLKSLLKQNAFFLGERGMRICAGTKTKA